MHTFIPLAGRAGHRSASLVAYLCLLTATGAAGAQDNPAAPAADPSAAPASEAAPAEPAPAPEVDDLGETLEPGADRRTGVRGRIVDKKSGVGLVAAPVLIQDQQKTRSVITDAQGSYRAYLPPGRYTLRSYYDFYHGARIDDVTVIRGKLLDVNLLLSPIDEEEDVVVEEMEIPYRADTTTAAAQDQLRMASGGIGEGFGAKQMSQVGASDAGSAASRVVGVTLEDKQLVIRGLGGRYSRVLLNGVMVPSIDPDVPGADLDLFPTGVIDSLTISKTFSPDMPADFAGGIMEIKSVTFPRQFTLELEGSLGVGSESTLRQRLDYPGGKYDTFGFDDGRRSIPDAVPRDARLRYPSQRFPDLESVVEAGRSFRDVWDYRRKRSMPNMGLDLTVGDSIKLGAQKRFGYLATAGYGYESKRTFGLTRPNPTSTATGALLTKNDYQVEIGEDEVQLSAFGTASLDVGVDHSMTVLSLYNRSVSDRTRLLIGNAESFQGSVQRWQLQYLARTLWFNQLFGDHRNLFGTRLRVRWAGFQAYGERDEPDRRTTTYGLRGSHYEWLEPGERLFSNLRQDDLGGNLSLRFPLWAQAWGTLGGSAQVSWRDFGTRRFRMVKANPVKPDATVLRLPANQISANYFGAAVRMNEDPRPADNYTARQNLYSGFFLLETPLFGPLSLSGGVRAEVVSQKVDSQSPFVGENTSMIPGTDRTDVDYLPGTALKYELTETMLLRAAYGMTVSRPQIRELAPYLYYDFLRDRGVEGNPKLRRTLIHNADLRWEWFFAEGQILALSAYYKSFTDPIELTILESATGSSQYQNGKSARNLGGEFEFRLNLGRISRSLRHFNVDSNLALTQSRIKIPEEFKVVRSERRLVGQAPYVANLSLRYHEESKGVTAVLVYNVVGPRIVDVASLVGNSIPPDIEEQAFHSLDFVASAEVGKHVELKLKVKNILLQKVELRQGDYLLQRVEPGLGASLGVAVSY